LLAAGDLVTFCIKRESLRYEDHAPSPSTHRFYRPGLQNA
jgi:hypothetical protein